MWEPDPNLAIIFKTGLWFLSGLYALVCWEAHQYVIDSLSRKKQSIYFRHICITRYNITALSMMSETWGRPEKTNVWIHSFHPVVCSSFYILAPYRCRLKPHSRLRQSNKKKKARILELQPTLYLPADVFSLRASIGHIAERAVK